MKQRVLSLTALVCLILSLAACGGSGASEEGTAPQGETETVMTEDEYQSKVEELSAEIGEAMASLSGLSAADEDAFREGIEAVRSMVEPFRKFAAITDPPGSWTEAHARIAEGCTGFADSLEGLCDSAEALLGGTLSAEDYSAAVTEHTAGLTEAAALLTEGFGMTES